jgi:hypothetical protein
MNAMSRRGPILAAIVIAAGAFPAWAHHSHGNYKMQEFTALKGTVKEIHWLTPHSWIYLEVKDAKDEPVLWALEGASVGELRRRGWAADSIKVGDTISVRCHVLQDGSPGCLLGYVTVAGGEEKLFD